jgi:hypothetical protein
VARSTQGGARGQQHERTVAAKALEVGEIVGLEGRVLAVDASDWNCARMVLAHPYDESVATFVIIAAAERLLDVGTPKTDGSRGHVYRESRSLSKLRMNDYVNLGGGRVVELVPDDDPAKLHVCVEIVRNWAERDIDPQRIKIEASADRSFDVLRPLGVTLPS